MFNNLKDTLHKERISQKQYADYLGISVKSAQNKIYGMTDFTYPEFKKTCFLLSKYNADFLFADDNEKTA